MTSPAALAATGWNAMALGRLKIGENAESTSRADMIPRATLEYDLRMDDGATDSKKQRKQRGDLKSAHSDGQPSVAREI